MQLLTTCVDRFWQAVDAELKRLVPGDELDLAGTKVAVVESNPKSLTLHLVGKSEKHSRAALPGPWALAVAEHRFDNSSANKLFLGAFLAVDLQGDRQRARQIWQKAQPDEPTAGELLKLLANANIPAAPNPKELADGEPGEPAAVEASPPAEPGEIPSKEKLIAAGQRLKQTYVAELRGAKSPESKLALAQTSAPRRRGRRRRRLAAGAVARRSTWRPRPATRRRSTRSSPRLGSGSRSMFGRSTPKHLRARPVRQSPNQLTTSFAGRWSCYLSGKSSRER